MFTVTINNETQKTFKTMSQARTLWLNLVKDHIQWPHCLILNNNDQLEDGQTIDFENCIFEDSIENVCIAIDYNRNAVYELEVRGQTYLIPALLISDKCKELYEEGEGFTVIADGEDVTEFIEW